jgi:uncharacterized protein
MSNRVVHFEIPFDDGDRARKFYGDVFGWEMMNMPEMGYTIVTAGPTDPQKGPTEPGFINGGMLQREGEWSSPNIVIDVPNLEDALRSVADNGGTVVQERQTVGDMGFAAYFKDPEGNVIGLWETAGQG